MSSTAPHAAPHTAIDFANALERNPAIVDRVLAETDAAGRDREIFAAIAEEMGYDVDTDEFLDMVRSRQRGCGELGEGELYAVAGGSGRSGVTYGYVCGAINSFMLKNNPWW